MTNLLPGELAWYATGRFYEAEDKSLADYGYFLHLPFVDVPLFEGGRPSEARSGRRILALPSAPARRHL